MVVKEALGAKVITGGVKKVGCQERRKEETLAETASITGNSTGTGDELEDQRAGA